MKINNKIKRIIYTTHAKKRLAERNINQSAIDKLIKINKKVKNEFFISENIGNKVRIELNKNDTVDLLFSGFDYDQIQQLKYLVVVIVPQGIDSLLVVTCFEKMNIYEFNKSKTLTKIKRKEVFI